MFPKKDIDGAIEGDFALEYILHGLEKPQPLDILEFAAKYSKVILFPVQIILLKFIYLLLFTQWELLKIGNLVQRRYLPENILDRYEKRKGLGIPFREILLLMGRRGSKTYLTSLITAYELYCELHYNDVFEHYGLERVGNIEVSCVARSGKQAHKKMFLAIKARVNEVEWFNPYIIDRDLTTEIKLRTKRDIAKDDFLLTNTGQKENLYSISVTAIPSTAETARGGATRIVIFEEQAHYLITPEKDYAADLWEALYPSTKDFAGWGLTLGISSPGYKRGKCYTNYVEYWNERDDVFVVKMPSWVVYENANLVNKRSVISYEDLSEIERRDPEFTAEWKDTMSLYIDEHLVDAIFDNDLEFADRGKAGVQYHIHLDPAKSQKSFAIGIGHKEGDQVIMDNFWRYRVAGLKEQKPVLEHETVYSHGNVINYTDVLERLKLWLRYFPNVVSLTSDQFNSVMILQHVKQFIYDNLDWFEYIPEVYEVTFTATSNEARVYAAKSAIQAGKFKSPYWKVLSDEIKSLTDINGKVVNDPQGVIDTSDCWDCYDDKTEVLTEDGWKLFRKLNGRERVATRNSDGWLEFQYPTNYIEKQYEGIMYLVEQKKLNFCVTPTHNMLIQEVTPQGCFVRDGSVSLTKAQDIKNRVAIPKTAKWDKWARKHDDIVVFGEEPKIIASNIDKHNNKWTSKEDKYLAENSHLVSIDEIRMALGRTRHAVLNRLRKLNIKRGYVSSRDRTKDKPSVLLKSELKDFAAFVGFWLAEGHKYRANKGRKFQYGYSVMVSQIKQEGIDWFETLLGRMNWKYTKTVVKREGRNDEVRWWLKSYELREYLRQLQVGDRDLCLPRDFVKWDKESLEALWEGLVVGDGSITNSVAVLSTTSKVLADDIQRLAVYLGRVGVIRVAAKEGSTVYFGDKACQRNVNAYRVVISKEDGRYDFGGLKLEDMEKISYRGKVYCVTVPNSTLLVRRKDIVMWCGNCASELIRRIQLAEFNKLDIQRGLPDAELTGFYKEEALHFEVL